MREQDETMSCVGAQLGMIMIGAGTAHESEAVTALRHRIAQSLAGIANQPMPADAPIHNEALAYLDRWYVVTQKREGFSPLHYQRMRNTRQGMQRLTRAAHELLMGQVMVLGHQLGWSPETIEVALTSMNRTGLMPTDVSEQALHEVLATSQTLLADVALALENPVQLPVLLGRLPRPLLDTTLSDLCRKKRLHSSTISKIIEGLRQRSDVDSAMIKAVFALLRFDTYQVPLYRDMLDAFPDFVADIRDEAKREQRLGRRAKLLLETIAYGSVSDREETWSRILADVPFMDPIDQGDTITMLLQSGLPPSFHPHLLHAARSIRDRNTRIHAMSEIALASPAPERSLVWRDVLHDVQQIGSVGDQCRFLEFLFPVIDDDVVSDASAIIETMPAGLEKACAMRVALPRTSPDVRDPTWTETLALIAHDDIDPELKTRFLCSIVHDLPQHLVPSALAVATQLPEALRLLVVGAYHNPEGEDYNSLDWLHGGQ